MYSRSELRSIRRIERKVVGKHTEFSNCIIPFQYFFENVFRDAAGLSFTYRCSLWRYYHYHVLSYARNEWCICHFDNVGRYVAAIDVALIISFAHKHVIINSTPIGENVLSTDLCQDAIRRAELQGVRICIIPCRAYDAFSVRNDTQMIHSEQSLMGSDYYYASTFFPHSL